MSWDDPNNNNNLNGFSWLAQAGYLFPGTAWEVAARYSLITMDMGTGPYHVASVGDTAVGGIMGMPPDAGPMPPAWGCYITVDNVDETMAKCTALGGKTLVPPMDVPTVGRMAVLQDPQGAVFSVMTYAG